MNCGVDGTEPEALRRNSAEYVIPSQCRGEHTQELNQYVENGWLKPYDEMKQGTPKGTIPLMSVESE